MSAISNIYDAIKTRVATIYPTKRELSDSLFIDNNDELSLNDGYAIHFGTGVNTNRQLGCQYSLQRVITITLTRLIKGTHKDIDKIETIEKLILEDHILLVKDFTENENIGAVVVKRDYVTDGGIERVFTDKKNFIMMETTFQIEYFEDL